MPPMIQETWNGIKAASNSAEFVIDINVYY